MHIKDIKEFADPNIVIMIIRYNSNPTDPVEVTASEGEDFARQGKLLFKAASLEDEDNTFKEYMHDLVKVISKKKKKNLQPNMSIQMKPPIISAQEKQEQFKKKKSWFNFFNRNEADKKEVKTKEVEKPKEGNNKENEISILTKSFLTFIFLRIIFTIRKKFKFFTSVHLNEKNQRVNKRIN